ncbi:nucleoside 2-deoxyribosyltransferase [Bacillus infantis]|uniref:nucleoside 2-deoxyribosyltransferase n=1 Tax=Bacillus infantis TaxID=324767 RepID=UPI003CF6492F
MKFYIGSSFANTHQVRELAAFLKEQGFRQTYDWTSNSRAEDAEELRSIGEAEFAAVKEADFVVIHRPAGKGSHIELGLALGFGKRVYLYAEEDLKDSPAEASTFYFLQQVIHMSGTFEELKKELIKRECITESR